MLLPKNRRRRFGYSNRFNPRRRTKRQMLESAVSIRRTRRPRAFAEYTQRHTQRLTESRTHRTRMSESHNEFDRPLVPQAVFEETVYGMGYGFDEDPYEERTGHDAEVYFSFDPGTTIKIVSTERGSMEWEYPDGQPEAWSELTFDNLGDVGAKLTPEQIEDNEEFVISNIVEMKNLSPGVYTFGGAARLLFDADVNVYATGRRNITSTRLKDSDFSGIRVALKESNGRMLRNSKMFRWI